MDPEPRDSALTMPAGRVLGVAVLALLVAVLLNTEAMVRAGEGMREGPTRDAVLSVARPLDDAAGAVGLHLPREALDLAFGQDPKTASGTELERGSAAILRRRRAAGGLPDWRQPTPERPLELLVTGDSEAQFVGEALSELDGGGLLEVEVVPRNGTGLTNPGFFNWELNAEQEVRERDPGAVVMLLGANDGYGVEVGGRPYPPLSPEWETEFARRAAVVLRTLAGGGRRPVYWVPPATARDELYNRIFRSQNRAVARAVEAVPGARYVDVYTTIDDGRYDDEVTLDGRRVLGRQPDGIHFSREGAVVPARLVLRALAEDFPALREDAAR